MNLISSKNLRLNASFFLFNYQFPDKEVGVIVFPLVQMSFFSFHSFSEYHYGFTCGLMYHIYSMCYNQLQTKLVFKEVMEDRAKNVVRKFLEEYTG